VDESGRGESSYSTTLILKDPMSEIAGMNWNVRPLKTTNPGRGLPSARVAMYEILFPSSSIPLGRMYLPSVPASNS